ncbi:MAG TPA: PAS domain S-box protein, partial [Thermosynechococcaceae cyanobacterium]
MAESVSSAATPDELLQQELTALRRRVTQLEQQLATRTEARSLAPLGCPSFNLEFTEVEIAHSPPDWEENLRQLNTQLEQRTSELRQNEARLQTIADSIPGTIFQFCTANDYWKMDYISDRVVDLTGIPAAEILQNMSVLSNCTHPDDRRSYFHSLLKAVNTGTPWQYEGRIIKPDGKIVWFQGEAVPSAHDRAVFYGVILDITDRKVAELALQESQQFIQSIADNSPNLLYLYDLVEQRSIYTNREAADCLGYCAAEVQVLDPDLSSTIIHPDDRDRVVQHQARIQFLEDGEAAELEYRLRHHSGEWRWFSSRDTVFKRDATGAVVQYLGAAQDITDRKQAQAELEESRRFLRRLLDTLPNQHIFWKDRNSVFLGCNRLAAKVAGLNSPQEIVGKTDYDLAWTTEEADFFRKVDRRVMDSNQAELGIIEPQLQADGKQAWLETSKAPLHDADGNVTGILVAFKDITERRATLQERERVKAQLQEQEQFLRSIYDGVDYSIFALEVTEDNAFRYLGMNSVAERAIGVSLKDYLGRTPKQVLAPEVAAIHLQRFEDCVQSGASHTWEDHLLLPDEAWWTTTVTPLKNETGRVHRLVGTSIDTTDRKRAEARLLEQEQFLRSIFDGVACSIFVVDALENGEFIYNSYNKAAEAATGFKSAEVMGQTPEERFGPTEGKLIREGFERCVKAGTALTEEEQFTIDGQEAWFMTTLNPLKDGKGRVYRIVGTAFNVLSLKQAQAQLQQQATDLEATLQELQRTQSQMVQAEKMSSLGQLVAGVAHEINNPVNFIFGNLNHANDYTQDLLNLVELYQKHYPNPAAE